MTADDEKKEEVSMAAAARKARSQGYLRNLLMSNNPGLRNKFSSTPIDPETSSDVSQSHGGGQQLTEAEQSYLESLLEQGDANMIEQASQRLCDPLLFPPLNCQGNNTTVPTTTTMATSEEEKVESRRPELKRRDSQLQQQLFRMHETTKIQPSKMLKQLHLAHQNSILDDNSVHEPYTAEHHLMKDDTTSTTVSEAIDGWNPFKDVSSWLDGSQGVEVGDNGEPLSKQQDNDDNETENPPLQQPFRILGTSADDVSCHPHVLSPPLMESLLAFVPDPLSHHNFLLKYSLVRDGANLMVLLKHARASEVTFLAIETQEGHVFGCYTQAAWRLAQGWYGSRDSFLWKMRRSRLETTSSIVQQAYQESEIQVYPYRVGSVAVQYCSPEEGLTLGQGEVLPNTNRSGKHYGHGLHLDPSLMKGTTSSSETFGNPCLVDTEERGAVFSVSNIEVWTLTPHKTVKAAEQFEVSSMFLHGARDDKNLNLINILVGGPI